MLRALHEALLHEPGGALLTPPRFQRLLPALVAQLGAEPDMAAHPVLAAVLEADAAAAPEPALPSLPAPPGPAEEGVGGPEGLVSEQGDSAYGRAAVAAVVQLAVAAGSDDLWKPLNHQARYPALQSNGCALRVWHTFIEDLGKLFAKQRHIQHCVCLARQHGAHHSISKGYQWPGMHWRFQVSLHECQSLALVSQCMAAAHSWGCAGILDVFLYDYLPLNSERPMQSRC